MRKIFSVLFVSLLTTSVMAGDIARSFKEAVALADAEDKDRATRIYVGNPVEGERDSGLKLNIIPL